MSDKNNSSAASGGIGLLGLVFIVFLVLKLAGIGPVAEWSWWWVTAPLWGPLALVLAIVLLVVVVFGVLWLGASLVDQRRAARGRAARKKKGTV